MKKWLLIALVICAPILAALFSFATVRTVDVAYQTVAPRIVAPTEATLMQLDAKMLAALAAGYHKNQKMILELWAWTRKSYEFLVYTLLGLVFALAAALTGILWKLPSRTAPGTDARPLR